MLNKKPLTLSKMLATRRNLYLTISSRLTMKLKAMLLVIPLLLLSKPSTNRDAIIDSLAQAIIYEIQDAFATVAKIEPVKYTSSNMLFSRFLELLSESAPKEREVTYYADRLFVSPKYLSAVCKEVCGNTASAIIGAYVTKEVERLLKANTMSIKEIANELNFSSI